jgi:hypothetical protein
MGFEGRGSSSSSDWSALGRRRDSLDLALARGRINVAQFNLQRALTFVRPGAVRRQFGAVRTPPIGEATLALRDLAASYKSLPKKQQNLAKAFLTRPDDSTTEPLPEFPKYGALPSKVSCTTNVCVHWVESGAHAPPLTDSDGDAVPDYVEKIAADVELAWTQETSVFGFRVPSGDGTATNRGPDSKLDLYVADIESTFGPAYVPSETTGTVYMVADNDYSLSIIPSGDPADGPDFIADVLSHELFHVIQNEYDFLEDRWLIEGTAAWMEDEMYDDLNYLNIRLDSVYGHSAFAAPHVPVDYGAEGFEYGAVLLWRFLGELYGTSVGVQDRALIERILELSSQKGPNSLEAVKAAIAEKGDSFSEDFAIFTAVNYVPEAFYEEGSDYLQLVGRPPIPRKFRVTITRAIPGAVTTQPLLIDHLSANYLQAKPGQGVSSSAMLKVTILGPPSKAKPAATVLVLRKDGTFQPIVVPLNAAGDGSKKVPFGKTTVGSIVLVLTNASTRFNCFHQSPFSCQGISLDDRAPFDLKLKLFQ